MDAFGDVMNGTAPGARVDAYRRRDLLTRHSDPAVKLRVPHACL